MVVRVVLGLIEQVLMVVLVVVQAVDLVQQQIDLVLLLVTHSQELSEQHHRMVGVTMVVLVQ